MPVWNFYNFFILKESLAFMFDMAHLHEDTLPEYDELEVRTLWLVISGNSSVPSDGLRVGQLAAVNWRMERLKDSDDKIVPQSNEVLYEVDANSENWMIAGRKRGHVALSTKQEL
ncbi:trafficking protein particle complex II-specific subunit 130 homolog [Silene latifolia]|uniref:trafficking protein particle complex II-specific subunit 130 homolog n=1 Tax=Silene latifolia TaxID=37657 RepID=UPI003D77A015